VVPHPHAQSSYEAGVSTGHVISVAYRGSKEALIAQITLRHALDRELGISLFAYGDRPDKPLADLPKLHIVWELHRLTVMDQNVRIKNPPVQVEENGRRVTFTIPWSLLDHPEQIYVQLQGKTGNVSLSQTGWQVLVRPGPRLR